MTGGEKTIQFSKSQGRKYTKISEQQNMILSNILTLLIKINLSYLELFITKIITPIENIRFEINLRFIWIRIFRIFYFSRRLFAINQTLIFWCRIVRSRSRSHKIRILPISIFLSIVALVISTDLKLNFDNLQSKVSQPGWKFHGADRTRIKSLGD